MSIPKLITCALVCVFLFTEHISADDLSPGGQPDKPPIRYAIAIHGGCGSADRLLPKEVQGRYHESLGQALQLGVKLLKDGHASLDVVEQVARALEDDGNFNAGKGAVINRDGEHELDASIMDGRTMACGGVAGVRTVKNPISLARQVMEKSDHVLMAGTGAEAFADEVGAGKVEAEYFFTPRMREIWAAYQKDENMDVSKLDLGLSRGTIGVVALDEHGNLSAATSTGGVCFKRPGRVGDSPIIGAGTFARNGVCAVSCTGRGEEFIRNSVAHSIAALMKYKNISLQQAVHQIIHEELAADVGAAIAVGQDGTISMEFNTQAMLRGAADSSGRFETRIWADE